MNRSLPILFACCLPLFGAEEKPFLELRQGENFFRLDGTPRLVLGRNPTAVSPAAFVEHFQNAAAAGEKFMRIHFCYMPPNEKPGELHPDILKFWDAALDAAEKNHLAVMPVCGVWADWNDGSKAETWHAWDKNPFNAALGGPARSPAELFEDGACRALWMKRLDALVRHWQDRRCIVAWEIFSELGLLTGSSEAKGVAFAEAAAKVIRSADRAKRPVTCSLAGANEWPALFKSDAVELVPVHPYGEPKQGDLDDLILRKVRERLAAYGKPVLIGECGLDWRPPRGTLDVSARAPIGIRHAVWAAVVSGALNARMLWWQDGYDQFEKADLCRHYQKIAASAAQFVREIDYSGLAPVKCSTSPGLYGAMLGSAPDSPGQGKTIVAWFRDIRCIAPHWPTDPTAAQWVTLPAREGTWTVELVDPEFGTVIEAKQSKTDAAKLRVDLPEFRGSVGVRARWSEPQP
ncbi:MAG TPA: hypothetical protein VGP72_14295 [Planctomycetota bacterium]|jgi:hypothetical protein